MDISIKEVKQVVKEVIAEIQAIRNHLHQYPEPSFKEFNTAAFIIEKLSSWGISPVTGMATTGLVVVIEGNNPSLRTVALRADMDALPINELNDVPYKSVNEGFIFPDKTASLFLRKAIKINVVVAKIVKILLALFEIIFVNPAIELINPNPFKIHRNITNLP